MTKDDVGNSGSRHGAFAGELVRRELFFGKQLGETVGNGFGKLHRIFTPL